MGSGTDVAMQNAGTTLIAATRCSSPTRSRGAPTKIRQNLFWAFIDNVAGVPLAALDRLSPVMAGAAMAFSSVSPLSYALLLRRWRCFLACREYTTPFPVYNPSGKRSLHESRSSRFLIGNIGTHIGARHRMAHAHPHLAAGHLEYLGLRSGSKMNSMVANRIDAALHGREVATGIRRRTLHSSGLGCIEDFSAPGDHPPPSGHSPEYQLVFPYAGAFEFHVGAKSEFLDATRVLFINAGEDYADSHVAGGGHDSIIITPHLYLLQELCGHGVPSRHAAFQGIAESTTARMNLRTHRVLRVEPSGGDPLASDELMIALLAEALGPGRRVAESSPLRVVDRAKQYLHAHICEPLSLDEIAQAVQVSGAYLTHAFGRCEGVSLCRYRMRLRLTLALVDLPRCGDITGLALNLGFSSHAHFTNAFKSHFGLSPSAFRAECCRPRSAARAGSGRAYETRAIEPQDGTPT